jgi:type III secretory pathway component EscS
MTGHAAGASSPSKADTLPPVTGLGVAALICTLVAGIVVAAQVPNTDTLWPAVVLLVVAAVLLATAAVLLARVRTFAWRAFFQVWQWAMVAYIVIAGMLEYVFIKDDTPGRVLVMLTLLLIAFALTVPLLLAFSVARFQPMNERR